MENSIKKFLSKSRKSTYASGQDAQEINGGKTYSIKESNLEYRDTYFDQARIFQGQEIILENNKPIFSMSYRGTAEEGSEVEEIFSYLKKVLREHADEVRLPGGREYADGDWQYEDYCEGPLEEFRGKEKIYKNKKLVYWMKYFGGRIE